MPTVMITGANRGIGLELARTYAGDGWRVIALCREPKKARELAAIEGEVDVRALDVADFARVDALARTLEGQAIDVLVNNAGVSDMRRDDHDRVDYDGWGHVFRVNAMAPLRMCQSFLDHVALSEKKVMAAMSSRMGSIALNGGGSYGYRSSKAALNCVMRGLAMDLAPQRITVVVLHPGWVRTDMGGRNADIDVAASVAGLRKVLDGLDFADSGRFIGYDGKEIPW